MSTRRKSPTRSRTVGTDGMTADELDSATGLFRTHEPSWLDPLPLDTVFLRADLRDFKRVNDDHGFAASQAVLVEMAQRLKAAAAPWPAYRVGGDAFLVIARLANDHAIRNFVESIRAAMERPPENDRVWTTIAAARAFPGATRSVLTWLAEEGIWAARRAERQG